MPARTPAPLALVLMLLVIHVAPGGGAVAHAQGAGEGGQHAARSAATAALDSGQRALRVGVPFSRDPFAVRAADGSAAGYDVALAEALAATLGWELDLTDRPLGILATRTADGTLDVAFATGHWFPAREIEDGLSEAPVPARSAAYRFERFAVLAGPGRTNAGDTTVEELRVTGRTIGAPAGTEFAMHLPGLAGQASIAAPGGLLTLAEQLQTGEVDAIAYAGSWLTVFARHVNNPNAGPARPDGSSTLPAGPVRLLEGEIGSPIPQLLLVRPDDAALLARINAALRTLRDNGTLTTLHATYIDGDDWRIAADVAFAVPEKIYLSEVFEQYFAMIAIGLFVLISAFFVTLILTLNRRERASKAAAEAAPDVPADQAPAGERAPANPTG